MKIWIKPLGNTGNRALQYLAAAGIRQHAPHATIQNIHLQEWNLYTPTPEPPPENTVHTGLGLGRIDTAGLADCLQRGVIETIILDDYAFHIENYPPRQTCREWLPSMPSAPTAQGFSPQHLVCSIRTAEILTAPHPDYILLPPQYYQMLAARTGLNLVFFGQLGDDPYSTALRQACPEAQFISGQSPTHDFETLRRSVNIAPSVSTFAWLAAWLSEARHIFIPVCGFMNPAQHPEMSFLPLTEPTFSYTLFPIAQAIDIHSNPAPFMRAQQSLAQQMRPVTAAELQTIQSRIARFYPNRPHLAGFDPDFYLRTNPDVQSLIQAGFPSALHHYLHAGFTDGRHPLQFDPFFYLATHPQAATAIAEGHYANALHHYQTTGRAQNYRPTP